MEVVWVGFCPMRREAASYVGRGCYVVGLWEEMGESETMG